MGYSTEILALGNQTFRRQFYWGNARLELGSLPRSPGAVEGGSLVPARQRPPSGGSKTRSRRPRGGPDSSNTVARGSPTAASSRCPRSTAPGRFLFRFLGSAHCLCPVHAQKQKAAGVPAVLFVWCFLGLLLSFCAVIGHLGFPSYLIRKRAKPDLHNSMKIQTIVFPAV